MPELRIPLRAVERASRITSGVMFSVPGDAALDRVRFRCWYGEGQKLERLFDLLVSEGIAVETMPRAERLEDFARNFAVTQRPGWIWRDRGWLAFIESAVSLAVALTILFLVGFFSNLPTVMVVWVAFILAVIVWGWFAGYRQRKRASR
jgi:hypothetical protein